MAPRFYDVAVVLDSGGVGGAAAPRLPVQRRVFVVARDGRAIDDLEPVGSRHNVGVSLEQTNDDITTPWHGNGSGLQIAPNDPAPV
jgi:hypothetical protein